MYLNTSSSRFEPKIKLISLCFKEKYSPSKKIDERLMRMSSNSKKKKKGSKETAKLDRLTTDNGYITTFEKAKVTALRAKEILMCKGNPPSPELIQKYGIDYIRIADEELKRGLITIIIDRHYPDGRVVSIQANKLKYR